MCSFCQNTVHMACAGSQPVNIDLDEWYCSTCNARFGDLVEPVTAAATVARTSAVGATAVASVAATAVVGARTPRHGESNQSASSIPSGLSDGDYDVAKGAIVVIKTDGELPFTPAKVLNDPVGSSQQAEVQYYMLSSRPMNAQNLEGSLSLSFTKKCGSHRLTKETHSVGLDWVALTWGSQPDMCSGASSSTGLPSLRASVLESLHQNEAVAWQIRKQKATPAAPAASKRLC